MKHQLMALLLISSSSLLSGQLIPLTIDGLNRNGHFGKQHSVYDSHILVAEPNYSTPNSTRQGRVHVFKRQGDDWLHDGFILSPSDKAYIQFGFDVAIDDNQLIVSAPDLGRGSVYVYEKNNDIWELTQEITIPLNLMRNDKIERFGERIELLGNWMAISSPGYLDDMAVSLNRGAVFIYRKEGDEWLFHQVLLAPHQQNTTLFAHDIELTASLLAVSAPKGDGGASQSGVVYLFKYNGSTWELDYTFIDPESRSFELFGNDVALDDDIVVIGVSMHTELDEKGPHGAAHVFQRFDDTWIRTAFLQPKDGNRNDMFGLSVAVEDRNVVIGAPRYDHEGTMDVGKVYLFQLQNGFWTETTSFIPPSGNIQSHIQFGSVLEIHHGQLVISGHLMNNSLDDSGIAYTTDLETLVDTDYPDENESAIRLHPNPVNESLHVVIDKFSGKKVYLTVYDLDGRPIHKDLLQTSSQNVKWEYNASSLSPGSYFLHVSDGKKVSIHKWVKI